MRFLRNILSDYFKIFVASTGSKRDLYDAAYAERMLTFSSRNSWRAEASFALSDINLAPGSRALDVGCNNGTGMEFLCERLGVIFEGVDISPPAIRLAKTTFPNSASRFHLYDGKNLPFDDAVFDLVCAMHVIGHVETPKNFLHEIMRVLKPGGKVIIITPNAHYKIFAILDSISNKYRPDPTVLRYYSPRSLLKLVRDCGLIDVTCTTFGERPLLLRPLPGRDYGRIRVVLNAAKPVIA